jgi:hypothetical protein
MNKYAGYLNMVIEEIKRAEAKFPGFPVDPIHAAAIVAEECGELQQACLQWTYDGGAFDHVIQEAVQTAAMALRFLAAAPNMEPRPDRQAIAP